ncbi:MAG: MASE3 domain-containing protein [Gemmatimonadota bacterium]|jgi:signal transduction histidine kinase
MTNDTTLARKAGAILTGVTVLVALFLTSLHSYLLFHSLIELFTVTVAVGVFAFAWNARRFLDNNYLLFVGIASLFVGILDVLHTLAYQNMGVFGQETSNLATQLWTAGRYVQSLSMLVAPFFLGRKLRPYLVLAAFAVITGILASLIFALHVFPVSYIEGIGLTPFKKISEYMVSLVYLGAIGLLYWKRGAFEPRVWRLLIASLVLTIASEITFAFYVSVYGEANMLGHFFRLGAFYALYKAVIETGLVRPYAILLRNLKKSEDRLREYSAILEARNEDLRRTQDRLREDALTLQQQNKELDAYAHTVAHDLKTPLSVIIGNTELVAGAARLSPEKRQTLLERIESTAFGMNSIVDNLLLLSEVRKADTPTGPVDMAKVVDNVRERLSDMIEKRGAEVTVPDRWPWALGYAPWIEEVWANYLSNALKYGGNPPRVQIGATELPDGVIRYWVRDNGPGVPPDAADRLFIPFNRLTESRETSHGLGLSIVVQIIEKLGGGVGAENLEGGGSLFYFTLPAALEQAGSKSVRSSDVIT